MGIAKAFDSVDRNKLLQILKENELVDISTFSIIQFLLSHTRLTII
jgi:hypothetical protein